MTPKKAPKEKKEAAPPAPVADQAIVVREATAAKANGRGITYQIGRTTDPTGAQHPAIRLVRNDGGGTFSKEWVTIASIRGTLPPGAMKGEPFRPGCLTSAFSGRSKNNAGFVACALAGEGLVDRAEDKDGFFAVCADWDEYERAAMAAVALPAGSFTAVKPPRAPKKSARPDDQPGAAGSDPGPAQEMQETECLPGGEEEAQGSPVDQSGTAERPDVGEQPGAAADEAHPAEAGEKPAEGAPRGRKKTRPAA